MTNSTVQRKLRAILSADVHGYGKLMGDDDESTVNTITAYKEIIAELVTKHGGRVVDDPGDNILAEFRSSIDTLQSAIGIQSRLKSENSSAPENRRMNFRIGINLGDILQKDNRIYGDGVNIAARIENLADPGGICISRGVYEQVLGKLDVDFTDLGLHSVKNIKRPVNIYKVLLEADEESQSQGALVVNAPLRRRLVAMVVALAVLAVGAAIVYQKKKPEFEPAAIERMAYPLPDKPSIALLPFENYSDDVQLNHFADGLTEDLTAALSKVPGLFVIARSSAATYKGKPVDVKLVAEEQGVQYVLEGSVQNANKRLRITAQLIDAINGRHVWSDRFDRQAKDIFVLQDEIVKQVIVGLQVELTEGGSARVAGRETDNLEAWLLRIEASGEFFNFTREGMIRARELYEEANHADPDWGRPIAGIAAIDWYEAKQGWSSSKEESIRAGMELARRAIEMDPDGPLGYRTLGNLYALLGQGERAIEYRRKAVALAPNDAGAIAGLATRLKDFGQEAEAVKLFEHALRLSPKHPWWISAGYGVALHLAGRKEEAEASLKEAIALKADHIYPRVFLTALYADLAQLDQAKQAATEAMRLNPEFSARRFMKSHTFHNETRDAQFIELMLSGGLPD